ncbi:uncharacterized protein LOC112679641 [Sipha flava]|uniref:Uncharacterized protein LOC112679641 n=2 Tax=Sipha flava TaxID=143950 RepID=A0A8B8F3Y3_9HEMI|nr:uncharacterized protein LOC112679641 [Sipha flava]
MSRHRPSVSDQQLLWTRPRPPVFGDRTLWFRCAMTAVAIGYTAGYYASTGGPQWVPDTDYLHWSTDVPAVTVCPAARPRSHSTLNTSGIENTLSEHLIKLTNDWRKKGTSVLCKNIFKSCSWNGKDLNCCRHFQPHFFVIENPCFSINSLQTVNKMKRLIVSHFSKKGELRIEFNKPVKILLHGAGDVGFGGLGEQYTAVDLGEEYELLYTARQVVEHISLASLDPSTRGCVVRGERRLLVHRVYSETACLLECAVRDPVTYAKNTTLCDCPPTCAGMEINNVWNSTRRSDENITRSILTMTKPATERLIMKARKDYIELTVVFSCLLQLFAGFNLLDIPKFISNKCNQYSIKLKN